ncbi:MAG: hypothetical protein IKJ97_04655 [Bacteroidaceae bacterium]|nr:hypothetical protein [Bacteroidaceae bacterium]
MSKKEILKSLRINHIFSLFAVALVIVAFETGLLVKGALAALMPVNGMYVLEVVVIMSTVLLVPYAIKGFSGALNKALGCSEEDFLKIFARKSLQRIFILFITLLLNTFVYYGVCYDGSLYCGLLSLCALLYSFPAKQVLEGYLEKNVNVK